jgi:hypothetical protein
MHATLTCRVCEGAAMAEPKVWGFFYGSYINLGVLREVELVPEQ